MKKIESDSKEETINIGKKLAAQLQGGNILCLYGDLGAGKTTLVKGLAQALGIKKEITSPTFALMNIYEGKYFNLIHIDTYRLNNEQELKDIGVEDYLGIKKNICVIEWPEKIEGLLKNKKNISVTIEHAGNNKRIIKIEE